MAAKKTRLRQDQKPTRDRLVEAAAYLIHRRGYHGVGISEILALSGAPKGVLYHHFPGGKPALAVAAIDYAADIFKRQIRRETASVRSVSAYIKALGRLTIEDLETTQFKAGCPLATIALETAPEDAQLTAACRRGFDLWLEAIADDLQRFGVEKPRVTAELVLSALEGALAIARTRKDGKIVRDAAAALAAAV